MKTLKILAWAIGILLVLLLIPVVLLMTIDLNNYKGQIARAVEQQTGRELRIQGPIEKSFFPWLGVQIGALELSNAPGFADRPFAQLKEAQVRVKLLPLFRKEIVADEIVLQGLQLYLARNAQGETNWQDLTAKKQVAPEQPAPQEAPRTETSQQLERLTIGGIDVREAAVVWDDRQANARYALAQLNLQTGELQLGEAFALDLSFRFESTEPKAQGTIRLSARIDADIEAQRYRVQNIDLEADGAGEGLPVPKLALRLSGDIDTDLEKQTADLTNLKLAALGSELSGNAQAQQILGDPAAKAQLRWDVKDAQALVEGLRPLLPAGLKAELFQNASVQLQAGVSMAEQTAQVQPLSLKLGQIAVQGALQARQIVDEPAYSGSLNVAPFNPRLLLKQLAIEPPAMADQNALTQATLDTRFNGTLNSVSLKPLNLKLDNTQINGSAGIVEFKDPAMQFALTADALDLDRYLPPPQEGAPQAPKAGQPPAEQDIPLPVDLLRALQLQGALNVGQLKVKQVKLENVQLKINANDGLVIADPVQARLYQGSSTASVTLDARGETPVFTLAETLEGVQFGPLVKDFMNDDYVSGGANLQLNLSTQGTSVSELTRGLNGKLGFEFVEGVVKYLDLADILIADYAKYLRRAVPADDPGKTTAFRVLKGTSDISNGVLSNDNLYLQSARFEVLGKGSVNLVEQTLDFTANTQIHNPTEQMQQYDLDKLVGIPIPVHFRGSFSDFNYSVDWEGVLRQQAKQAIRQERDKLKLQAEERLKQEEQKLKQEQQELKDKAEQKKQEELKKLEDKLKDRFKSIF